MTSRYGLETADGLAALRHARDRFLGERVVPEDLPAWLSEAWRRTLFDGVDADRPQVRDAATPPDSDSPFARASRPVLETLAANLAGMQVAVVLSDSSARVVQCWSTDPSVRDHLERIDTRPGADLSEVSTGPNSASHVIRTGRPAVIGGPQHIFGLYQSTTCTGSPVHDPISGRVLGAVGLVAGLDTPVPALHALASTAADGVQRELLLRSTPHERRLLDAYLEAVGRGTTAVAALDGRTRIVSDAAAAMLRPRDLETLETHAAALDLETAGSPASALTMEEAGLRIRFEPVAGTTGGVLATVSAMPRGNRRPPLPPRPLRSAGLVGTSAAWLDLERAVHRAPRASALLLLHGEEGTGKTVVARALAGSGPVVELDVDTEGMVGEDRLAELPHTGTVIVRHVERLPAESLRSTVARLDAREGLTVLTAVTETADDPTLGQWRRSAAPHEIVVPALRDRGSDVLALIRDAAGRERRLEFTQDARTALARYDWPGNVRELEHLTAALLAAGAGAQVPVPAADLPAHVLRPRGGRLGELERAERGAIVATLAATEGNKKRAAARLGISRATLYRKLRRFGLQ